MLVVFYVRADLFTWLCTLQFKWTTVRHQVQQSRTEDVASHAAFTEVNTDDPVDSVCTVSL